MVCSKTNSLEALKEKSEHELGCMLGEINVRQEEELRRLCRALHNLRRYMGKNLKLILFFFNFFQTLGI